VQCTGRESRNPAVSQITVRTSNVHARYPRTSSLKVKRTRERGGGGGGRKTEKQRWCPAARWCIVRGADSGERVAPRILAFSSPLPSRRSRYLSLHPAFGLSSMCRGFAASRPPAVAVDFRHTFLNPSPSCSFPMAWRRRIFLAAFPRCKKQRKFSRRTEEAYVTAVTVSTPRVLLSTKRGITRI